MKAQVFFKCQGDAAFLRRGSRGFTLVELMVVIVLIGILAGLAAPPLREMVLQQRVRNASFDLNAALLFTRSEALKRNANVALKGKADSTDWSTGWFVEGTVNGATVTLKEWGPYSSVAVAAGAASVTFQRSGRVATAVEFEVDDDSGLDGVAARCVTLDPMGKPATAVGACP